MIESVYNKACNQQEVMGYYVYNNMLSKSTSDHDRKQSDGGVLNFVDCRMRYTKLLCSPLENPERAHQVKKNSVQLLHREHAGVKP